MMGHRPPTHWHARANCDVWRAGWSIAHSGNQVPLPSVGALPRLTPPPDTGSCAQQARHLFRGGARFGAVRWRAGGVCWHGGARWRRAGRGVRCQGPRGFTAEWSKRKADRYLRPRRGVEDVKQRVGLAVVDRGRFLAIQPRPWAQRILARHRSGRCLGQPFPPCTRSCPHRANDSGVSADELGTWQLRAQTPLKAARPDGQLVPPELSGHLLPRDSYPG